MSEKISDHVVKAPTIIGSTTINHSARVELGMNCSEYVLMNWVYHCAKEKKPLEVTETYQKTGFKEEEQLTIIKGLILKGFVILSEDTTPHVTSKWESGFTDIEEEFDNQFWKKDNRVVWIGSSRKLSLAFYIKVRKKYDKKILIQARDEYIEYLEWCHKDGFNRQIMGAEKWLNEKNEYYLVDWKQMSGLIKEKLNPPVVEPNRSITPITEKERKEKYK